MTREDRAKEMYPDAQPAENRYGGQSVTAGLNTQQLNALDLADKNSNTSKREAAIAGMPDLKDTPAGPNGTRYENLGKDSQHSVNQKAGVVSAVPSYNPTTPDDVQLALKKAQADNGYVKFGSVPREINQNQETLKAWDAHKSVLTLLEGGDPDHGLINPKTEEYFSRPPEGGAGLDAATLAKPEYKTAKASLDSHIRQQYEMDNPQANAIAAYWGVSNRIYTQEAHDAFIGLLRTYGTTAPTPGAKPPADPYAVAAAGK